jgi:hypothetical protein
MDSYLGGSTGNHEESSVIGFSIHDIVLADDSLFFSFLGRRRDISSFLALAIPEGLKVSSSPKATQSPPSTIFLWSLHSRDLQRCSDNGKFESEGKIY